MSKLILASASPRRAELLTQLGVHFEQRAGDIDESVRAEETAADYVLRMAVEKSRAAVQQLEVGSAASGGASSHESTVVLAADTSVVVDGVVFGKPQNQNDAANMLRQLSARQHVVMTSVAVVGGGIDKAVLQESRVWMRAISDAEMLAYWNTREPLGKAGGYAVQGRAAQFIERIDGSYSGIMGLPLFETAELLSECGFPVL